MTDVLTTEQRHKCMSHIKGKNTKPEIVVRKFLFANGFRFRLFRKDLPGNPDIVLPKYRTAIFINGCFWHAHKGCKYATTPKTNTEFWTNKINKNCERDEQNHLKLRQLGWNVIVIWECQLKPNKREETLAGLRYTLDSFFLKTNDIKPYSLPETETTIAAEEEVIYEK